METVVAPVDQTLPNIALDVRITLSPGQKVVGPFGVMVGVGGVGLIVIVIGEEVSETQVPSSTYTQ
jgi:hypothetical protein